MPDLYWVGGTASWDGTIGLKWALTSGGVGGLAIPTSTDNAFEDGNSGAGTTTLASGNTGCLNLDFTGYTGIFAGSATLAISGGLTVAAGMTYSNTGTFTFNATSGTKTLTSNGKTYNNSLTFDGVGGTWQFADAHTLVVGKTIALANGTLDINGKTITAGLFTSNVTNTRTFAFGSGNIVLTTNNAFLLDNHNTTGLTITGTPVFNLTYSGSTGTRTIRNGSFAGATLARGITVNITAGSDIIAIAAGSQFLTINFTGFSGTYSGSNTMLVGGSLTLASGMTWSNTGTITFNGTSGTQVLTSAGKTFANSLTMNGVGGTLQYGDNHVNDVTATLTLTNGTVDGNGKNITFGFVVLGSGTKTLTLGSGTWTVSGAGVAWSMATNGTNLTVSAATAIISMTSGSAKTFAGNGKTWPTLSQGGVGALTVTGANTFAGISGSGGDIILPASTTTTVSAFTYGSGTLRSSSAGTAATISKSSGTVSVSNLTIIDSTATGGATFNAFTSNGCVDGGGNSGWNFSPAGASTGLLALIQ